MLNINKNESLVQLQELIKKNMQSSLEYMPSSFNEEQKTALELFQKRLFLEEIVEETISFNRKLHWENKFDCSFKVNTAEELIEIFKLRSDVYDEMNYKSEFPDPVESLNFDIYDKTSAIIYNKKDNEISATCRLIFDSNNLLPSDEKYCFNKKRVEFNTIGEISRNIVKTRNKGLNLDFKYSMAGMHNIFVNNNINMTYSVIRKEHYKLFSKFGGINIVEELKAYGTFDQEFLVISWNPSEASKFFHRSFLR